MSTSASHKSTTSKRHITSRRTLSAVKSVARATFTGIAAFTNLDYFIAPKLPSEPVNYALKGSEHDYTMATFMAEYDQETMMGFNGPWFIVYNPSGVLGNTSAPDANIITSFDSHERATEFLISSRHSGVKQYAQNYSIVTPRFSDSAEVIALTPDTFVNGMHRYHVTRATETRALLGAHDSAHYYCDSRDMAVQWATSKASSDIHDPADGSYMVWDMTHPFKPVATR